ncbi:MAG: hypothetical protein RO469_03330 [Thermincola sp.]|jgi:hypothetical protein|nr:hypothetical protein [Thermincola sp.]MDT3702415.1 hypothetical protein [Thermincola sp.]
MNCFERILSPGKDGKLHREAWWKFDKPCEVAAVYGLLPGRRYRYTEKHFGPLKRKSLIREDT